MRNSTKAMRVAVLAAIAIAALSPSAVRAQGTPQQRSACMGDAFRYCFSDIPNVGRIEACLNQNVSRLTPACQMEFKAGSSKLQPEHFR
jgi:hypothetical protein